MTDASTDETGTDATEAPEVDATDATEAPEVPLLTLRDGLPAVVETPEALAAYASLLAAGSGPVAVDAERASGYRYSSRAYLLQLRREGAGTALVDPVALLGTDPDPDTVADGPLGPLVAALAGTEWILHAATQDLPCLAGIGLRPDALFDTELAGRLLGYPRVGLGTLVETVLGRRMRKEHSAVDWSTRPLPRPWLEYAALDVEVLVELREALGTELERTGKAAWAAQEFAHLLAFRPTVRAEPWRRTSGTHRLKGRRALAAVRELWETRDAIARDRDVTPGRIVPDAALVVAAQAMPADRATLLATPGFHGRGAERYSSRWLAALQRARDLPEADLPARSPRSDGPPTPRAWADRDPVAARRLELARPAVAAVAEGLDLPVENLLTPDYLRRAMWEPPATRDRTDLAAALADQLRDLGARPWQVGLVVPALVDAVVAADEPAAD